MSKILRWNLFMYPSFSSQTAVPQSRQSLRRRWPRIKGAALLVATGVARADDFIVYSPHVTATQSEIELRGYQYNDPRADFNGGSAAELSVAHAFNGWWKSEVYLAEYKQTPGGSGRLIGYELENTFQLTQPGQYWADFGFLASYEHQTVAGKPDAVEFGPLIEKTVGRFDHTFNAIWEKEVGSGAGGKYEFRYSYSGTYTVSAAFADRNYKPPIASGLAREPGGLRMRSEIEDGADPGSW